MDREGAVELVHAPLAALDEVVELRHKFGRFANHCQALCAAVEAVRDEQLALVANGLQVCIVLASA